MNKIFDIVLNNKAAVITIFAILLIVAALGFTMVNTNSDMVSYLDNNTDTIKGKEMLSNEFGIHSDGTIGISNVERSYIDSLVAELTKYDIIEKIVYIGSFDDMVNEINNSNNNYIVSQLSNSYDIVSDKYYKETTDTYIISFYTNTVSGDDKTISMLNDVESFITRTLPDGGEYAFAGSAPNAKELLESSAGEMPLFVFAAVIGILFILLLFSRSFFEPIVYLTTLGVAILLNLGSNALLSQVSSITFSSSVILQLALSMDYAIFLMHSYYEEKKKTPDTKAALRAAIPKSLKAVSASAITTIGGFIALFSMRYGMGYDLGIVLAKGVVLSLITIMVLQPILIMLSEKLIDKTSHREIAPTFKLVNSLAGKKYKLIIAVCLLMMAPAFIMQFRVDLNYLTVNKESSEITTTQQVMREENNQIVLIVPYKSGDLELYRFLEDLKHVDNIDCTFGISSIVPQTIYLGGITSNNPLIESLEGSLSSNNYCLNTITLNSSIESEETYLALEQIKALAGARFGEYYITGLAQGANDLSQITPDDFVRVSIISAIIILIILMLTFKSIKLAFMLVMIIELGIWINLSITYLMGTSINFMSYIIISAIQLGATVDYAIIVTSKYREIAKEQPDKIFAVKEAMRRAGPSVMISALVLFAGSICVRLVTSNVIVSEITELIAHGALLSFTLICTLLPSLLILDGKRSERKLKIKELASTINN